MLFHNQTGDELSLLGCNVQALRIHKHYTLQQLAQLSKYDRVCLSNLEKGIQNIKYKTVLKLSKALDISFPLLFSSNLGRDIGKTSLRPYFEDDFLLIFVVNFKRTMLKKRREHLYVYTQSGIQEAVISRIISGAERNPTIFTLMAMAQACSTDLETMFTRNM